MQEMQIKAELLPIFKEHNLKSIHNDVFVTTTAFGLLPIFKEHNLKSIHNTQKRNWRPSKVVTNIQRTQFKINSQLRMLVLLHLQRCYQYSKNTI